MTTRIAVEVHGRAADGYTWRCRTDGVDCAGGHEQHSLMAYESMRDHVRSHGDATTLTINTTDGYSTLSAPAVTAAPRPLTGRHYVSAAAALACVIAIGLALTSVSPVFRVSIISACTQLISGGSPVGEPTGGAATVVSVAVLLFVVVLMFSLRNRRRTWDAAESEERKYRAGSEQWSWTLRLWSCARFGFVHIWNVIVPVGAAVALAFAGVWFMGVYLLTYRRTGSATLALRESTAVHAAYNTILLRVVWVVPGLFGVALVVGTLMSL